MDSVRVVRDHDSRPQMVRVYRSRERRNFPRLGQFQEFDELQQVGRQFEAFPMHGRHRHGVTSVFKRHSRQPPLRGLVPHEASSKIIA